MKIQIVKCDDSTLWYKMKPLPIIIDDAVEAWNCNGHNMKFHTYEYYYSHDKMAYILKSDCINNEEYCIDCKEVVNELENRIFSSGAKRDSNKNKSFVHNLKGYLRLRFGYHMNKGSLKYGDSNWELGMPSDQYLESVDRHLAQYLSGNRDEDHLSAIIFGIQGVMMNEEKDGIKVDDYFNK